MLSESRDGCDLLLDADSIAGLGSCLSEMKRTPALLGEALFSLGNMTKSEAAIQQVMNAKLVEKLVALLADGEEDGIQMQALVLKCIWNVCNMDAGKLAIIDAGGRCCSEGQNCNHKSPTLLEISTYSGMVCPQAWN